MVAAVRAARRSGLVLALLAGACAATGPSVVGADPGAAAPSTISPSEAAAESYSAGVTAGPPNDPFAVQLKAELDRLMKQLGRPPFIEDARFDKVADDIARITAERDVSASSVVTFLLAYYGVVEPEPNLIMISGLQGSEASAIADLAGQFAHIPAASAWRRVGIGVWRRDRSWTAVLALQEHNLSLDPLPRALPSGGHATLSGRVLGVYRSPEILVTSPQNGVHRLPVQVQGKAFRAQLECSLGDGAYQVEISAEDRRGPTVLANFPIYCGVAPPAALQVTVRAAPRSTDPEEIERQILDLMDRDRMANGLPALRRDARLAQVARVYSREMAEDGEVGHLSERSGSAVDRVRAAGISPMPTVVAENVGRDYSAADAERGFMSSPGHRDNILSRAVTHVGVGVAMGKREGNATPIFVTQIFAGWGQ
jgi:uncharacterized protein YkwD